MAARTPAAGAAHSPAAGRRNRAGVRRIPAADRRRGAAQRSLAGQHRTLVAGPRIPGVVQRSLAGQHLGNPVGVRQGNPVGAHQGNLVEERRPGSLGGERRDTLEVDMPCCSDELQTENYGFPRTRERSIHTTRVTKKYIKVVMIVNLFVQRASRFYDEGVASILATISFASDARSPLSASAQFHRMPRPSPCDVFGMM